MKARKSRRSTWESLESRQLLSASLTDTLLTPNISLSPSANTTSTPQGYSPAQIKAAYGFSSISFNGVAGTGAGQTIAVVDAFNDPNLSADLAKFSSTYNLPQANLTVVGQTGKSTLPKTDPGWAQEISLDVEWAHAIAPGAKILLVEANSDSLNDLLAAVDTARNAAGVSVVSMSWGTSEFPAETSYDSHFTTPAGHTGVTFVSASGDEGSYAGAEWPASSPNVLSVGGTTLTINPSTSAISSESPWSDSSGGISSYERAPSYQSTVTGSARATSPDVSYDANPSTGFAVYDSLAYDGSSGWMDFGGTSAGAPQWAALIAIADQGRSLNGATPLDGPSATLPTLFSLDSSPTTYASSFNDITSTSTLIEGGGGFGFFHHRRGGFPFFTTQTVTTDVGYDTVTGLGSPEASAVVSALVGAQSTPIAAVKAVKLKVSRRANHADDVITSTTDASSPIPLVSLTAAPSAFDQSSPAALTASLPKITFILSPVAPISSTTLDIPTLTATPFSTNLISAATSPATSLTSSSLTLPITETLAAPQTTLSTPPATALIQKLADQLETTAITAASVFTNALDDIARSEGWQTPAAAVGVILMLSYTLDRLTARRSASPVNPFNTLLEISPAD